MEIQPLPVAGALGFYGPDPGGPRSPNVIREVRGSIIEVREIVTGAVAELTFDEWWSARQMCADTDRIIEAGNFDRIDMAARVRAMNEALACYARVFPRVVESANETETAAGALESFPELLEVPRVDATAMTAVVRGTPLSLDSFSVDFLELAPLDAPATTPLPLLDLQHADEPVPDDMDFVLPELSLGRHAEAA